ncbi:MAG: hypothetical protein LBC74_03865 [Planctomycetaceae bacterium]|jgi:flagellar motor switch protein FliG|nr:hypothetical protein [Planctomycetaceae bacterium]
MNGIKKTAKLLSGLDWQTISQLLNRLDSETAGVLRREIMSVGKISLEESEQLANEFLKAAGRKPQQNKNKFVTETFEFSSGAYNTPLSLQRINNFAGLTNNTESTSAYNSATGNSIPRFTINQNILHSANLPEQSNCQTDSQTAFPQPHSKRSNLQNHNAGERLFEFLFNQTSTKIAEAICREHPQTIAVVLAALPDSLAGETLSVLPPSLQQNVGRRLAEIKLSGFDLADNPVLLEIESELKQRFNQNHKQHKQYGISFDDLERFDDAMLVDLFRSVDIKTAMFALVGAKPRFIERITGKFTPTEEFLMRKLLKEAGMIDEKEVENARAILLEKASVFI